MLSGGRNGQSQLIRVVNALMDFFYGILTPFQITTRFVRSIAIIMALPTRTLG
jgi:hypothetical protein